MTVSDAPFGFVVVDKPGGVTSHDVVAALRRGLGTREVGHAGTLDPMATGVLVAAIGEATKIVPLLMAGTKHYRATLRLGEETESHDADGAVVQVAPVPNGLDVAVVRAAATAFVGEIEQRAPRFSAVKIDGQRAHQRARRGEDFESPLRRVRVHSLDVATFDGRDVDFEVTSDKGLYVRVLAYDLARALGTVGHLTALRRLASGAFRVEDAVSFDLVRAAARDVDARRALRVHVRSPTDAAHALPLVRLDAEGERHAAHGRPIPASCVDGPGADALALALDSTGTRLAAIVAPEGETWRVVRGFRREDPP